VIVPPLEHAAALNLIASRLSNPSLASFVLVLSAHSRFHNVDGEADACVDVLAVSLHVCREGHEKSTYLP